MNVGAVRMMVSSSPKIYTRLDANFVVFRFLFLFFVLHSAWFMWLYMHIVCSFLLSLIVALVYFFAFFFDDDVLTKFDGGI